MMDQDADPRRASAATAVETLIARVAASRDRAAYAALFHQFAPRIKAFVMGQGLSAQEAEDLAQDAMLSVWRKAHMFDPRKAGASTWIYAIARNLRIDRARKAARARDLPEDLWRPEEDRASDQRLINAEEARSVTALIDGLSQEQQIILKMSFYEDLSHSDIARALAIPLGTVKSRLRLAMARLKDGFRRGGDGA